MNYFNTLTLKQIFWKRETFFKKLEYCLLVESSRLKTDQFPTKLPYEKPMLRQIEWWIQNEPFTKNRVLTVTTLFFWWKYKFVVLKIYFRASDPFKQLLPKHFKTSSLFIKNNSISSIKFKRFVQILYVCTFSLLLNSINCDQKHFQLPI